MLVKGCKVIVLQPVNTGTAGNMVKTANNEGVKVLGYDSMLVNGPLDMMVMQDSWAVGQIQAEEMVKWFKSKKSKVEGNIVLIKGHPGDSNAAAMSEGILKIINDYDGLYLVAEKSHESWSPYKAMQTTENILKKYDNKIDAFICNNSGMARGVITALKTQGLASSEKIFVAGSDADLENIKYVSQGIQSIEIWKKIKPLAEKAAEIAVLLAKGKEVKVHKKVNNGFLDVPTIVTPIIPILKDNIDSTIISSGFYTKDQIYNN